PTASTRWAANHPSTVTWNVANTTAAPVNCNAVDILYSSDSGQTFAAVLANGVPNSGSAHVTSPNTGTLSARIEVRCNGNVFFDVSPGNFSIITDDIFMDGFEG